jgi:adenylylsulfate kinase-like enzyme
MIIWFTGQPGSGKTTLANKIISYTSDVPFDHYHIGNHKFMHIDGDDLRTITVNKDYSKTGRRKNIQKAIDIARFLEAKGFTPVISVVAPYRDLRESLKETNDVKEIFLHTREVRGREHYFAKDYQKPNKKYLSLNTSQDIDVCVEKVLDFCFKPSH